MTNLASLLFSIVFSVSVLANINYDQPTIIQKAKNQPIALENLVKSYLNLNANCATSKADFECKLEAFDKNIDKLFDVAEKYGVQMIRIVGAQSNAWHQLSGALKLPPTKQNRIRVFRKSRTLLAENDRIINAFKPVMLKNVCCSIADS